MDTGHPKLRQWLHQLSLVLISLFWFYYLGLLKHFMRLEVYVDLGELLQYQHFLHAHYIFSLGFMLTKHLAHCFSNRLQNLHVDA